MREVNKTKLGEKLNSPANQIPDEQRTEQIRQGFRVVSSVPTRAPRDYYESIVIYVSGSTYRLYVYDEKNSAWRYSSLT